MNYDEAKLYLEHTNYDDFNLEEHQINNRLEAIKTILKENGWLQQKNQQLQQKNEQLKEALKTKYYCKYADRCDELNDCTREEYEDMAQANMRLANNWDELKQMVIYYAYNEHYLLVDYNALLNKMKELEGRWK